MRKFLCLFIVLGMLSSCADDSISNSGEKQDVNESPEILKSNEDKASKIFDELMESFAVSSRSNSEGEIIYPDYYGGAYINNEGNLVILAKGDTRNVRSVLSTRSASEYLIESCTYSFNELKELNEQLRVMFEGNEELARKLKWNGTSIMPKENRVCVDLQDCSEQNISLFKTLVSASGAIIFEENSPILLESGIKEEIDSISTNGRAVAMKNAHPGSSYSYKGTCGGSDGTFRGSVGFRAMSGTQHGFVTAAHCLPKAGIKVQIAGIDNAGESTVVKKGNKVDAAFVKVEDTIYPTNITQYGKKVILFKANLNSESLAGKTVFMEGSTSQAVLAGKVNKTSGNYTISKSCSAIGAITFYVNYMVFAEFTNQSQVSDEGDSGCIVYTTEGNANYAAGIYAGRSINNATKINSMAFSSVEKVLSELGISSTWVK